GNVRQGAEIFGHDLRPDLSNLRLNFRLHLQVIDPDASGLVELQAAPAVELGGKEPVHLFDAALMRAARLHDFVEHRNIERHHRNGGAGLGDQRLVDGDEGAAAVELEQSVDAPGGALQVVFGHANRAVFIDRPGDVRADVTVGDGGGAGGEKLGIVERVHPHLPILATHDGDGLGNLSLRRWFDRNFTDDTLVSVDGLVGVRGADRLQHRFVNRAGFRMGAAGRGQGINHQVDRAEFAPDQVE